MGHLSGARAPHTIALVRPLLRLLPVAVALLAAACNSTPSSYGASALIRWRLMDASTGTQATPCMGQGAAGSGACCVNVGGRDITVDVLRLRAEIIDPDTGALSDYTECPTCCFHCDPNEWSTGFVLPAHRYRLSVEAYACGRAVGFSPAPLIRTLGPGDSTNMQVQEIILRPSETLDPSTGGAICPRGEKGACCPAIAAVPADASAPSSSCPR